MRHDAPISQPNVCNQYEQDLEPAHKPGGSCESAILLDPTVQAMEYFDLNKDSSQLCKGMSLASSSDCDLSVEAVEVPTDVADLQQLVVQACSSSTTSDPIPIPGKVINLLGMEVRLLRVEVVLNGKVVVGIVDSGAECSLISSSLANELNLDISDGSHTLKVVGQDNFNTVGSVMTDINIHGMEMKKSKFIVYPNVKY